MKKIWDSIKYEVKGKNVVVVSGCPELEGKSGILDGDGMVFFFGEDNEFYVGNTLTGTLRIISSGAEAMVLDSEIDHEAITRCFSHGCDNALAKTVKYACMNRYDGFKGGICAISWMLYPDGRYFADECGFGMEDNDEEEVYAIIDTNLDIIEPFRPVDDVAAYLKKLRDGKTPKSQHIYNLIIIDESGSMQSIRKEAVDSVNETLQTIRSAQNKHKEQNHFVTLVTFNNNVKTILDRVSISDIKDLTTEDYHPTCFTALYDAMGISLNALRKSVDEADTVLVTVVTDGYENASQEYSGPAIKSLVSELKSKGWVFAYIGANQDVEAVAANISITNVMNFEATSAGTVEMSAKLGHARSRLFDRIADCCFNAVDANTDFFDEI